MEGLLPIPKTLVVPNQDVVYNEEIKSYIIDSGLKKAEGIPFAFNTLSRAGWLYSFSKWDNTENWIIIISHITSGTPQGQYGGTLYYM